MRTEGCTKYAIEFAIEQGHEKIVEFLTEVYGEKDMGKVDIHH